ncbi:NUDIX hydrolase [Paenibacillus sp. MMO-177]|uniref:NUDIX hydrolase n=1 Tax=Paenibacillus sp. MMO-177 TaxID=3081289 RepID=UPI0030183768
MLNVTITDSDFIGGSPAYLDTVSRYAARGVVFNNQGQVAMMYMAELDLYKLPGGGMEEGE